MGAPVFGSRHIRPERRRRSRQRRRLRTWSLFTVGAIGCSASLIAERLGGCAAPVYRLCESGALPHIRIVNSIRVRTANLDAYQRIKADVTMKDMTGAVAA